MPEYIWQMLDEFSQAIVPVGPPIAALVKQVADLGEDAAPAPAKQVADPGDDAAPAPAKRVTDSESSNHSKHSRHTAK